MSLHKKARVALVGLAVGAMTLSACSAGSLGSSSGSSGAAANTTITYLVDNADTTVKTATALVSAFNALNQGVTVKLDTRPAGTDGDNAVKTKLATGDMAEVFNYNSGSLMAALDPGQELGPVDQRVVHVHLPGFVQDGGLLQGPGVRHPHG